ncbi:cadherin-related tumor suppressor [Brachionus plicatilis]|uniref:Cadherin-related tumor suppressor n=1 Tax=Brachionus plicatilis TaxID=10195 RepID=A0A3M7QCV1_BRAPC|nr:cadherin-related tumor suppressor [Brachionus plicatilis]
MIKIFIAFFLLPYWTNAHLKFSKDTYSFTITENSAIGTFIGKVSIQSNRTADYRIVPLSFLMTESNFPVFVDKTGSLYTQSHIDREKYSLDHQSLISFNLEASINSFYSYCRVNLLIQDLNDNHPNINFNLVPKFTKENTSELFLYENSSVNQILAYVGITDNDFLENGTISSIELNCLNGSCPVRLSEISTKLYTIQLVGHLEYSTAQFYDLELTVKDNGSVFQLETTTYLKLNVMEVNKHAPMFTNNVTSIELTENSIGNYSLFNFTAVDFDLTGDTKFKLEKYEDYFFLKNGQLWQKSAINQSMLGSDKINLTVMAYDNIGGVQLSSLFELEIKIIDLNDHLPEIKKLSSKLKFYLNKKERFVKIAPFILVTDLDSLKTNSIHYKKNSLNETKKFILNRLSEKNSFKFLDLKCKEAFSFKLNTNFSLPFVFLVESIQSYVKVKCRMSIWLDTTNFRPENKEYDFDLMVSDNGAELNYTKQNFRFKIELDSKPELEKNKLFYYKINNLTLFESNIEKNAAFYFESVSLDKDDFMVFEDGYLCGNESCHLVQNYTKMLKDILESEKVKFNGKEESEMSFLQLKKILFNSDSVLISSQGKIIFYLCISIGVVLLVCFLFAIFLRKDNKLKNLNVIDDKSEKCQNLDYDKPEAYSDSSSNEDLGSPYSSLELKSNYSKLYMLQKSQMVNCQFNVKICHGSGSSNYAESDEGCYGSSDFSSERDLESKQQHLIDSNKYVLSTIINVNNCQEKIVVTESYV